MIDESGDYRLHQLQQSQRGGFLIIGGLSRIGAFEVGSDFRVRVSTEKRDSLRCEKRVSRRVWVRNSTEFETMSRE